MEKKIYLVAQNLKNIPKNVLDNVKINVLDVSNNNIQEIQSDIQNMGNLTFLNIGNNLLKKIPQEIENLYNLRYIVLANNKFKEIPLELSNIENLEHLDLQGNDIERIDPYIEKFNNIKCLNLNDNNISYVSMNILKCENLGSILIFNNPCQNNPIINKAIINKFEQGIDKYDKIYQTILNLMEYYELDYDILSTNFKYKNYLINYCKNKTFTYNMTFKEILNAVLTEVYKINKADLFALIDERFKYHISDCDDRVKILINCLNGYSDKFVPENDIKIALK